MLPTFARIWCQASPVTALPPC